MEKAHDFGQACGWADKVRVRGDISQQLLAVAAEGKKVILFLNPLQGDGWMIGTFPLNQIIIAVEGVTIGTIPAGVDGLINIAALLGTQEHLLGRAEMALLGRAYPAIVPNVQLFPGEPKSLVHAPNPARQIGPAYLGSFGDVLAILVKAHAEVGLIALQAPVARDRLSHDLLQRVADMWFGIRIVDGRGNIVPATIALRFVTLLHGRYPSLFGYLYVQRKGCRFCHLHPLFDSL